MEAKKLGDLIEYNITRVEYKIEKIVLEALDNVKSRSPKEVLSKIIAEGLVKELNEKSLVVIYSTPVIDDKTALDKVLYKGILGTIDTTKMDKLLEVIMKHPEIHKEIEEALG